MFIPSNRKKERYIQLKPHKQINDRSKKQANGFQPGGMECNRRSFKSVMKGRKWAAMTGLRHAGKALLYPAVLLFLLRIVFAGLLGMMPQEAYYFFYSRHPALSYYDHPPAIAWLLRLFTAVLGKHLFVLRLAATCTTLCSLVVFYFLARKWLSAHRTIYALLLFFSTFIITDLSLVSSPDVPLLLFWTLSLLSLYRAVFEGRRSYWIWSGLMMGLAFDSKYTAIFLPIGLILFLILSKPYRRQLVSPGFFMALIVFLLTISPVLIWNARNHFASFHFQSGERLREITGTGFHPEYFLGMLGHQAFVLIPVLFFFLLYFSVRRLRKVRFRPARIRPDSLFLLCFFLPLFTGFALVSMFYWVKMNWIMPAYISGIVWVSIYFREKWLRRQWQASILIHLALAIEIIFYPFTIRSDDTWAGWPQLAGQVERLKQEHPGYFVFSADDYKTSSVLNFYLDDLVYGQNIIGRPALQFDYIGTDLDRLSGKNALFLDSDPGLDRKEMDKGLVTSLAGCFDSIGRLPPILIRKNGRVIRKFDVLECRHYHPEKRGR
jgi:hypothetical protein